MNLALSADSVVDAVNGVVEEVSIAPIVSGMGQLIDVMGEVWKVMIGNPLLLVYLGASLFSVGIWIFKKVKRAARG